MIIDIGKKEFGLGKICSLAFNSGQKKLMELMSVTTLFITLPISSMPFFPVENI